MTDPRMVKCPQCGNPAPYSDANTWRPFCSQRCRLIDLGEWASEGYQIAAEPSLD
ncbi:MAG: DNA gyrase inhibitor YacG, partial [Marinobacterium sp.]